MDGMDILERIHFLSEQLRQHQHLYYVEARPSITDLQYDALFNELQALEKRYPQHKLPDSPSLRVGSDLDQTFPSKEHQHPILSLDKANSPEQVLGWTEKIKAQFPDVELLMEDKIDGLSIVLYYEKGLLTYALTRGDGERGNDITENAKTIRQIPLRASTSEPFIVRGEIYLEKKDFDRLNLEQAQRFSNPRNLAAGSIRLSHSSQVARIPLKFAAHDAYFIHHETKTHLESLKRLHTMGFPLISPIWLITEANEEEPVHLPQLQYIRFADIGEILEFVRLGRAAKAYEIDGLVLKVNQLMHRNQLGTTSHHPRWAIAFKFDAPCAETRLLSIDIQVGRNGRITPVANLEPVPISGSTVSRATLHNQLTIDTLNIGPGDLVTVSKRGDVIPAVDEVIKKADLNPSLFTMPSHCPSCHSPLQLVGAHHFCLNRDCPQRIQKQIIFFAAKGQMDIVGMGEQTLRQLYELGYVRSITDLYRFNYDQLIQLPGFGIQKVENIKKSIENSKKRPFSALLSALGIEGLGPQSIRLLIENGFHSMNIIRDFVSSGKSDHFTKVPGIGPALTQAISQFFSDPSHLNTIEFLAGQGLNMWESPPEKGQLDGPLKDQSWVITGTLQAFQPRDKAAALITRLGGIVTSSISQKTTHLLVGASPGSKLEKARKMGITTMNETEFLQLTASTASAVNPQ